jgi:hypothetical protein
MMPESEDGRYKRLKAASQRCGICNRGPMFNWALRFGQVCDQCEKRAVDSKHRPIFISQQLKDEDGALYIQNPKAFHSADPKVERFPDSPCAEVNDTGRCWIDGIECQIWEGRMGGSGLVVVEYPQERLRRPK